MKQSWKLGRIKENSNAWKGGLPKCLECGKQLANYKAKYCREHFSIQYQNKKHPNWKGNEVGYSGLHLHIHKYFIKSGVCTHCKGTKKTVWASKNGEYKSRERKDWLELCYSCHNIYDDIGRKVWEKRRGT